MIKTAWNKKTESYTVSNENVTVRNIPVKSQAECVAMELRNGWPVSFGDVEDKKGGI